MSSGILQQSFVSGKQTDEWRANPPEPTRTILTEPTATDGHCQRLAPYAVNVGSELGLAEDEVAALARGGFLHDIGTIGIPDAVLLKPTRLTPAEFEIVKQHPVIGDRLCARPRPGGSPDRDGRCGAIDG